MAEPLAMIHPPLPREAICAVKTVSIADIAVAHTLQFEKLASAVYTWGLLQTPAITTATSLRAQGSTPAWEAPRGSTQAENDLGMSIKDLYNYCKYIKGIISEL